MAGGSPGRFGFGREARLRHRRDFVRLRKGGERVVCGCLIANWQCRAGGGSRLGVITARNIGGAVVRSRARRLLRESFRLHQHELARAVDVVLVARRSIVGKDFAAVESDFLKVLRRAGLWRVPDGK